MHRIFRRPPPLAAILALELVFMLFVLLFPAAPSWAQATATTTVPSGFYDPSGRFQSPVSAHVMVTKDGVTGLWCIAGSSATCVVPGSTTSGATEATLSGLRSDLATPAATLPPIAPAPKGDTTYTRDFKNISSVTDTVLISATSSQTGRLHRIFCTIDAADTLIFKDGSTAVSGTFRFPSGGGVLDWPLDPYAYLETTANTALNLTTSTAANVNCSLRYKKD